MMATTSQTLIPTNTLASGSSTPTNGSNNGGDIIYDLFGSSGSPALIVTFLAIGLFVVAMTGVFGWRRFLRPQGLDTQLVTRPNSSRKSISLGKRPMFWDVWADLKIPEKSPIEAMGWENIMPMTALVAFLIPPSRLPNEPLSPINSMNPGSCMLFRMVRSLGSAVKRFYLPHSPPPPPPLPPLPTELDNLKNEVIHASDEIEWGDASSLQVSVIIAMPTQRCCTSGMSLKDVDPERMALGEFCIGTMDVPWSEGG